MALSTAGRNSGSFLSDEFRAAIARRCRELIGLVLLGAVAAAAAALATWSVNDPSFSHATNAPVRNVLGAEGAIAADLAMQLFGLAAIAIILPPGLWGWRLFSDRPLDRLRPRLAAWIVGLVLAAGFASCLPRTAHWPLPCGIGGVIGDAVLRFAASLAGAPLQGMGHTVAQASFGALGFAAIVIAAGFGFHRSDKASAMQRIGTAEDEADDGANGDVYQV